MFWVSEPAWLKMCCLLLLHGIRLMRANPPFWYSESEALQANWQSLFQEFNQEKHERQLIHGRLINFDQFNLSLDYTYLPQTVQDCRMILPLPFVHFHSFRFFEHFHSAHLLEQSQTFWKFSLGPPVWTFSCGQIFGNFSLGLPV